MSSSGKGRSRAPLDRDLQRLYDEVWEAYAEDLPPPKSSWSSSIDKDLDNVYNLYAGSGSPDLSSSRTREYLNWNVQQLALYLRNHPIRSISPSHIVHLAARHITER